MIKEEFDHKILKEEYEKARNIFIRLNTRKY
jgi:hypothetical protein